MDLDKPADLPLTLYAVLPPGVNPIGLAKAASRRVNLTRVLGHAPGTVQVVNIRGRVLPGGRWTAEFCLDHPFTIQGISATALYGAVEFRDVIPADAAADPLPAPHIVNATPNG